MLGSRLETKHKELCMVFVDLEKAYDRVHREQMWWSPQKKRVPEAFIKIIQDMYEEYWILLDPRNDKGRKYRVF